LNQKGKFTRIAEAMRNERRMEELKQRILDSAKKAGLEEDLEVSERQAKVSSQECRMLEHGTLTESIYI
jgi:cobalamin biosynthesis Mg chelatase CobN